jgi:hypothetical protein
LYPHAPTEKSELVGTFTFDCNQVKGFLILKPNSTFTQLIEIKATGEKASSKGHWSYEPESYAGLAFGYVRFPNGFLIPITAFGKLDPNWSQPKDGAILPCEYRGSTLIIQMQEEYPPWRKEDSEHVR